MNLVTEPLGETAIAPLRRRPGSALIVSLALHALAVAVLFFVPLKIVEWSHAKQRGPFEVTLADESTSEESETEFEPVPEEPPAKPKPRPARVSQIEIPVEPPAKVILVHSQVLEMPAATPLAYVTVPDTFTPSLEFENEAEKEAEKIPEPVKSKPAPTKARPKPSSSSGKPPSSSANAKIVGARVIRNPSPAYPATARARGYQGTAIFSVAVSSKGSVNSMRLSKSSGHSSLDSAAAKALRRWKFAPASRGGVAVASQVRVPIQFRIR